MAAVAFRNLFRRKSRSSSPAPNPGTPPQPVADSPNNSPTPRDDSKSLKKALLAGDVAKVQKLIATTPTLIHRPVTENQCAIHLVAESGHLELIDLLERTGADMNIDDTDGNAPLVLAMNSMAAFSLLVRSKNIVLARKFNGQPLLHHVCRRFTSLDEDILRRILKKVPN